MKKLMITAAAAFLTLGAAAAHADTTTTVWFVPGPVDLRAGPDSSFPVVATAPEKADMTLNGCLHGWSWCDVSWNGQHGWVSGKDIESIYRDKTESAAELGSSMSIPVVSYNAASYWDEYYRSAPFYSQRSHYSSWAPADSSATATSSAP